MEYCSKCVYPSNSAINMNFDNSRVCSGCSYFEEMDNVDWEEREKKLSGLLQKYRNSEAPYDCIIPVSGGKDSHFQTYLIKEVFGLKPLLVTFNHSCSPLIGLKNMANIVERFGVDHVRFSPNPVLIRKLMKYTLKKRGDACWFCQGGVVTVPIQMAIQYKIPLIIWGEHGWSHLAGKNSLDDMVEFSVEERSELFMRGLSIEKVLKDNPDLERRDLSWLEYPSTEEIERTGVRGIYLGNYYKWNQKALTEFVIDKFGFTTRPKARTYNTYADVDCHLCSGTNDYLKYLKFGYGRTTDHASQDIREGRISREEGIKLVKKYDNRRPEDLDTFLAELELDEEEFYKIVDRFRDPDVWERNDDGEWIRKASADIDPSIDSSGADEIEDRMAFVKNWTEDEVDDRWYF